MIVYMKKLPGYDFWDPSQPHNSIYSFNSMIEINDLVKYHFLDSLEMFKFRFFEEKSYKSKDNKLNSVIASTNLWKATVYDRVTKHTIMRLSQIVKLIMWVITGLLKPLVVEIVVGGRVASIGHFHGHFPGLTKISSNEISDV